MEDDEASLTSFEVDRTTFPEAGSSSGAPQGRQQTVPQLQPPSFRLERAIFFLLYVAAVIAAVAAYKDLQQKQLQDGARIDALSVDLIYMTTRVKSLELALDIVSTRDDSKTSELESQLSSLSSELSAHDGILIRLSNRTTNADVLDELHTTKAYLSEQLAVTKDDVSAKLSSTERKLNGVVLGATTSIQSAQRNVTLQLAAMEVSLAATVDTLNEAVESAKTVIHDEMKTVQENIDEYVAVTNKQFAAENDFVKYQLAGTFTLLGCLISMWHLTSHVRHAYKPEVQRRIMAVLWMVPIYSITSWLSLVFPKFEPFLGPVRDIYEAYAVYTFIALLIAILEDGKGLKFLLDQLTRHVVEERRLTQDAKHRKVKAPKEHLRPPFPCCYIHHRPSSVAAAWLRQCQLMGMQFVLLKPLLAVAPFVLKLLGLRYDELPPLIDHHALNWHSPKLYVMICQNVSVAVAFYGLLSFYHGTEKELAWCNPWPKFLCIKGVVFMTFWQGVTINLMASMGMVDERAGAQVQNLLICIEMLVASLAHFYIFPYQEWEVGYKEQEERRKSIRMRDTMAFNDFRTDVYRVVTPWAREMEDESDRGGDSSRGSISAHISAANLQEEEQQEQVQEQELSVSIDSSGAAPGFFSSSSPNPSPPVAAPSSERQSLLAPYMSPSISVGRRGSRRTYGAIPPQEDEEDEGTAAEEGAVDDGSFTENDGSVYLQDSWRGEDSWKKQRQQQQVNIFGSPAAEPRGRGFFDTPPPEEQAWTEVSSPVPGGLGPLADSRDDHAEV